MKIKKSIAINLASGAWTAALIVLTTPWFVSRLGLEGYGLIGFWMVVTYITLILDFGLGSTCARELARALGRQAERYEFRTLLLLFERPMLLIGALLLMLMWLLAPWLGSTWLNIKGLPGAEVARVFQWMSVSVGTQVVVAFYGLALGGLQKQGLMNGLQALNNGFRYLGGALVVALGGSILAFFIFQGIAALVVLALSRWTVLHQLAAPSSWPASRPKPTLRDHLRFSGGMFTTALLAAGISNADRLFVSKLLAAEMLGRYTIAATVIGLLQMFIVAFHRVYQPRFAELTAADNGPGLRRAYYQACMTVGAAIIPTAVLFVAYTNEIFVLWVGWSDPDTTLAARLLVSGYAMAGLMWLPASYQQAIGWTRLNVMLMAASWLVGMPVLWLAIRWFGLAGASAMMLTHGVIQLALGLRLMNQRCFPGEDGLWVRRVILGPLALSLPVAALGWWLLPAQSSPPLTVPWMLCTALIMALLTYRTRARILGVEASTAASSKP